MINNRLYASKVEHNTCNGNHESVSKNFLILIIMKNSLFLVSVIVIMKKQHIDHMAHKVLLFFIILRSYSGYLNVTVNSDRKYKPIFHRLISARVMIHRSYVGKDYIQRQCVFHSLCPSGTSMFHLAKISNRQKDSRIVETFRVWKRCL